MLVRPPTPPFPFELFLYFQVAARDAKLMATNYATAASSDVDTLGSEEGESMAILVRIGPVSSLRAWPEGSTSRGWHMRVVHKGPSRTGFRLEDVRATSLLFGSSRV